MTTANITSIEKLREYIKDFYNQRSLVTDRHVIQAKELHSLQNAIKIVAQQVELTEELEKDVNFIIAIDDEWWCFE